MKREEIYAALGNCETYDYGNETGYKVETIDDLIDKIYDDFENRTCENCSYFSLVNGWKNCELFIFEVGIDSDIDESKMSCNEWKEKN